MKYGERKPLLLGKFLLLIYIKYIYVSLYVKWWPTGQNMKMLQYRKKKKNCFNNYAKL